jgi:hypothetical protein
MPGIMRVMAVLSGMLMPVAGMRTAPGNPALGMEQA